MLFFWIMVFVIGAACGYSFGGGMGILALAALVLGGLCVLFVVIGSGTLLVVAFGIGPVFIVGGFGITLGTLFRPAADHQTHET